jgi:hypothetical protein
MIVIVGLRWHRRLWGEGWVGVDGTDQPWVTVTRDWNGDTWGGWLAPEICRRPGGIRIQSYVSPEAAMAAVDRAVDRYTARWGQREIGRALAERRQRAAVEREREARGTRGPGARLRR